MLSRIVVRTLTFKWICSWCTRYSVLFYCFCLFFSFSLSFSALSKKRWHYYFPFRIFKQIKYSIEFNWNTCKHSNKFMLITLIFAFAHCATFHWKPMRKETQRNNSFLFILIFFCSFVIVIIITNFSFISASFVVLTNAAMSWQHSTWVLSHCRSHHNFCFRFCFRLVRITN